MVIEILAQAAADENGNSFAAVIVGLGALVTATGGAMSAWSGVKAARNESAIRAEEDCQKRLKAARAESEAMADELHKRRMKPDEA